MPLSSLAPQRAIVLPSRRTPTRSVVNRSTSKSVALDQVHTEAPAITPTEAAKAGDAVVPMAGWATRVGEDFRKTDVAATIPAADELAPLRRADVVAIRVAEDAKQLSGSIVHCLTLSHRPVHSSI